MALFEDHWTAADGVKLPVFAHDAVDILGRTTAGWCANNARAHASSALAAKLQTKVIALEAKLANPTPKDSANSASKLATRPKIQIRILTGGFQVLGQAADEGLFARGAVLLGLL